MVIDDPVFTSHTDSTLKNVSSKYGVEFLVLISLFSCEMLCKK